MPDIEMIGAGIKILRKQKNMTLADVSEATGFSISYLSKIERNQGSITIDAIMKICSVLDMDIIEFLRMDFGEDIVLVRRDKRKIIYHNEGIVKYELVTSGYMKKIKGLIVTLYPDVSQSFAKVAMPHTTDEYGFILEGEMILRIADKNGKTAQYHLKAGDSYYIYAGEKHALKCYGDIPCVSLWSYTSPLCFSEDNPSQH